MPKKNPTNPIEEEKLAAADAEGLASESAEASQAVENLDEEAEKGLIVEEAADTNEEIPAELSAIHDDNESARDASGDEPTVVKKTKKTAEKAAKPAAKKAVRSKKYLEAKTHIEAGKRHSIDEAIALLKKISATKFDSAIELHLKLNKKKAKGGTESSRGIFHLPHGSGKNQKIIILDEAKIDEIAKTKKIDFDVALATPELMPKVAKIAKILGPKGKMPDPKAGTVTTDAKKTIDEINSGKVEYRVDSSNNVHQMIGRVSWPEANIQANAQAIFSSLPKAKIAAAYLTASMSPSVTLDLSFLK